MTELTAGILEQGKRGEAADVREIMNMLDPDRDMRIIKIADTALTMVRNPEGVAELERFLFSGTGMQRNYCVNYFRRREMRTPILRAWEAGLIDSVQAFSR